MTLYLLPNLLGSNLDHSLFLPISVDHAVSTLDGLIAESEGGGRRYLKQFSTKKKPHEMPIALLKSSAQKNELDFLLEPVINGENWGVVSDCGLPCLADPGAALVRRARYHNLLVHTFSGPSSITHALVLSGLSGQSFHFHGYLPKEPKERAKTLKVYEKTLRTTHIFIEAPYRNLHTYQACLDTLKPTTLLSVATQLTTPEEWIQTAPISWWRTQKEISSKIMKKPTIFLFTAEK
ncbi:MAG: Ribosomal RNA small subunit methyltransferase I [Chlamydiae bacterium]|nr:Ribosomal RNA small subunit methyltransferase I [Chlamydiota bacterium]